MQTQNALAWPARSVRVYHPAETGDRRHLLLGLTLETCRSKEMRGQETRG